MNKVVILAAGRGSRMRRGEGPEGLGVAQEAAAVVGRKALMPMGSGVFLDYVLSAVADAGLKQVCLVVSPEDRSLPARYGGHRGRLEIEFAVQRRPLGTADALCAAEAWVGEGPCLLLNSDTYYPREALEDLRSLAGPGLLGLDRKAVLASGASNLSAAKMGTFALLATGPRGILEEILEKPDPETYARWPEPVLVSVNAWRFEPSIFHAARSVGLSPRGEMELPDAVRLAMASDGGEFRVARSGAPILDLSTRGDVRVVEGILAGRALAY